MSRSMVRTLTSKRAASESPFATTARPTADPPRWRTAGRSGSPGRAYVPIAERRPPLSCGRVFRLAALAFALTLGMVSLVACSQRRPHAAPRRTGPDASIVTTTTLPTTTAAPPSAAHAGFLATCAVGRRRRHRRPVHVQGRRHLPRHLLERRTRRHPGAGHRPRRSGCRRLRALDRRRARPRQHGRSPPGRCPPAPIQGRERLRPCRLRRALPARRPSTPTSCTLYALGAPSRPGRRQRAGDAPSASSSPSATATATVFGSFGSDRSASAAFADLDPLTLYRILELRVAVFVVEQACAYPELDGRDVEVTTRHLWIDGRRRPAAVPADPRRARRHRAPRPGGDHAAARRVEGLAAASWSRPSP